MKGALYLGVEAGAAPVHHWLIGSRDPERLDRALSEAIERRKAAVRASDTATA
jgi:hypothetical protein